MRGQRGHSTLRDLTRCGFGEEHEVSADQPPASVQRHNPADDEHALPQSRKRHNPHIRIDPIDQIIDEIVQHDRVTIGALRLEASFDDVAPPQHHLPLTVGQRRPMLRDKSFDNGATIRQPMLQREMINGQTNWPSSR
ncbi:hypothetical protein [Nocardia sp. NBC_01388]|uniref:hypothetical protein n=1 Tax=Nocardia sp. NBC_01388 TaxID=2903596 RepID=UPI00324EB643